MIPISKAPIIAAGFIGTDRPITAEQERAAIVAWLRQLASLMAWNQAAILEHAAENISLGAHLPHPKGGIDG